MKINCPICKSYLIKKNIINLKCDSFDESKLYKKIKVNYCKQCSHIFNDISSKKYNNIKLYYQKEYANINLRNNSHKVKEKNFKNSYNQKNNKNLYNFIKNKTNFSNKIHILDLSCGTGSFLKFLKKKNNLLQLHGNEPIKKYYLQLKKIKYIKSSKFEFEKYSSCLKFDIIILDQALEHIKKIQIVKLKIKKYLKDNGSLIIGVPDSSRYYKYNFFPFYWFIMREHIHHFNKMSVLKLFSDFQFIKSKKTEYFIFENNIKMPNEYFLFKKKVKINKKNDNKLLFKKKLFFDKQLKYIKSSKKNLKKIKKKLFSQINSKNFLFIYGLGREFFFLFQYISKISKNYIFIDNNKFKNCLFFKRQKLYNFNSVLSKFQIKQIFISSYVHKKNIQNSLKKSQKIKNFKIINV